MASSFRNRNRSSLVHTETTIIDEVDDAVPGAVIPVNGKLVPIAQGKALLQNHVAAMKLVDDLTGQRHNAVQAADALLDEAAEFVSGLRNYVAANFGVASDKYVTLGFTPPKKAVKTPAVLVAAAEKGKQTREARHTMGKVQKKAVHGAAPAATTTAEPAPAAPAVAVPKPSNG